VSAIDAAVPLELLNGMGMVLSAIFLVLMVWYLWKETRRRKLPLSRWFFRLPPSMHFAVAITVYVFGVMLRTSAAWCWRRFGHGGEIGVLTFAMFGISAVIIAVGAICQIRAVSKPNWGDGPWLLSTAAVIGFVMADLYFR